MPRQFAERVMNPAIMVQRGVRVLLALTGQGAGAHPKLLPKPTGDMSSGGGDDADAMSIDPVTGELVLQAQLEKFHHAQVRGGAAGPRRHMRPEWRERGEGRGRARAGTSGGAFGVCVCGCPEQAQYSASCACSAPAMTAPNAAPPLAPLCASTGCVRTAPRPATCAAALSLTAALHVHVRACPGWYGTQGYSQYRVLGLKQVSCMYQNWRIEAWERIDDAIVRLTISPPQPSPGQQSGGADRTTSSGDAYTGLEPLLPQMQLQQQAVTTSAKQRMAGPPASHQQQPQQQQAQSQPQVSGPALAQGKQRHAPQEGLRQQQQQQFVESGSRGTSGPLPAAQALLGMSPAGARRFAEAVTAVQQQQQAKAQQQARRDAAPVRPGAALAAAATASLSQPGAPRPALAMLATHAAAAADALERAEQQAMEVGRGQSGNGVKGWAGLLGTGTALCEPAGTRGRRAPGRCMCYMRAATPHASLAAEHRSLAGCSPLPYT